MKEVYVFFNENFENQLKTSKFRSVRNEVKNEIKTLQESPNLNQRIYKNLFEKRIKDDFRLIYYLYEYKNIKFFILILLITNKKEQQETINILKKNYEKLKSTFINKIKENFKLEF